MAGLTRITLVVGAALAAVSTSAAAQETRPAVVGSEQPAAAKGGVAARVCGVVHQEGRSDCTHDRLRSRRTLLAFLGAEPGEEGTLTPDEQRELDRLADGLQPIHDRSRSMYLLILRPTAEQLANCPKVPPVTTPASARPHKWRRTIREDLPCPKW